MDPNLPDEYLPSPVHHAGTFTEHIEVIGGSRVAWFSEESLTVAEIAPLLE